MSLCAICLQRPMNRNDIFQEFVRVRELQDRLYGEENSSMALTDAKLLAILVEQVGDVASMVNYISKNAQDDGALDALREALLHVGACTMLWLEK